MSFFYGEGRYKPQIKIKELTSDTIEFLLTNVDVSFANSLRRVIISEVPTMAIDMVQVIENTSPLFDDFVVHRIGLVPLVSEDIDKYIFPLKCSCKEGCSSCQVLFDISVKCDKETMDVTSNDIKPKNSDCKVKPVEYDDPIVLTKLKKGQSINMTLTAKKGIGQTHAKWSPVCTCVMKPIPEVVLIKNNDEDNFLQKLTEEDKIKFCDACPSKVFGYDKLNDEIVVENSDKCTFCEECLIATQNFIKKKDKTEFKRFVEQKKRDGMSEEDAEKLKMNQGPSINYRELIKVEPKEKEFLFKVETTRALSPKKIITSALNILKEKFSEIDKLLNEIEEHDN